MALFHSIGKMRKTSNSEILKELEINSPSYENLCKKKVLLVFDFIAVLKALSKLGLKNVGDMEVCTSKKTIFWFLFQTGKKFY